MSDSVMQRQTTVRVSVRLPAALVERLDRWAASHPRWARASRTTIVERALVHALEQLERDAG